VLNGEKTMNDDNILSQIEEKAGDILKDHNGVYLEKRLYTELKKEFSGLTRKDFQDVLESLLKHGYSMERGLIRRLSDQEAEKQIQDHEAGGKKAGKGASGRPRLSNKRGI
jgi:hypothetical protein